ncbi:MAG: hypothetical protein ABIT38_00495, partial [Gemmatimonadaceae bacterium]
MKRPFPLCIPRLATAVVSFALAEPSVLCAQTTPRWSVETPTGPSRTLSFEVSEGTLMNLAVSPDGRSIAFDLLGSIYEIPIGGGTAKRLTSGRSWNLAPQYSPDGRSIAFSSDRAGSFDVWTLDRQSGALERITTARLSASENYYRPSWSSDGRRIYATASTDGAPNEVVALDRLGSRQVLLKGYDILGGVSAESDGVNLYLEKGGAPLYSFEFNPYVTPPSGVRI